MYDDAELSRDATYFERALGEAVLAKAIQPAFQPIVHLRTGEISSFEVLARWQHPRLGNVNPSLFISTAERVGLIGELTSQLIRSACSSALRCGGDFRLAINISPFHFQQGEMPDLFEDAVNASGFPLDRTQIEITENAVIDDAEAARATIDLLREKGVRIVLDDFGTGYSSLTRLQALPFDKIKIDASFVRTMCEVRDSRKIVSAVIGLGHSLGMPVVAEGVETEAQADMLTRLGCDLGQGWLFGRPVQAEAIPALLLVRGQKPQDTLPEDLSINQRLAHLEAVYAVAPVGLCFIDKRLHIQQANQRFAKILERGFEAVVGQPISAILPGIADQLASESRAPSLGRDLLSYQLRLSGGRGLMEVNIAPALDEKGEFLGFSLALEPKRSDMDMLGVVQCAT